MPQEQQKVKPLGEVTGIEAVGGLHELTAYLDMPLAENTKEPIRSHLNAKRLHDIAVAELKRLHAEIAELKHEPEQPTPAEVVDAVMNGTEKPESKSGKPE